MLKPPAQSISIALATYNGAKFIEAQLQSFADQELVVTDDGSSDDTLEKIRSFGKSAPFPVQIHRNETQLGFRRNFLKAAALCTSEIVAYSDQDDIWHTNKLKRVEQAFESPETLLVHHNARVVDAAGQFIRDLHPAHCFASIVKPMDGSPWVSPFGFATSFRTRLMKFLPLHGLSVDTYHPGEPLAHDQWVTFLASALGCKAYIEEPLVDYRQHGANTFGVPRKAGQSLLERMHLKLEDRSEVFARLEQAASINANIMAQVAASTDLSSLEKMRAQEASERWEALEALYALRTAAYTSPSLLRRADAVSRLTHLGAYGRAATWSFGKKSQARDILLGIMAGPLITKLGARQSDRDPGLQALRPLHA